MGRPISARRVVLLVDDDSAVLSAMSFALTTDGWEVVGYPHAEAVLESPFDDPDCVVLDQNLPGLSGLDLLANLRALGCAAPALIITSNPTPTMRQRAHERGAEILEKPLLGDTLSRTLNRFGKLRR